MRRASHATRRSCGTQGEEERQDTGAVQHACSCQAISACGARDKEGCTVEARRSRPAIRHPVLLSAARVAARGGLGRLLWHRPCKHGRYCAGTPTQLSHSLRLTWADHPTSERIVEDIPAACRSPLTRPLSARGARCQRKRFTRRDAARRSARVARVAPLVR